MGLTFRRFLCQVFGHRMRRVRITTAIHRDHCSRCGFWRYVP